MSKIRFQSSSSAKRACGPDPADAHPADPLPERVLHPLRVRSALPAAAKSEVRREEGHLEPQGALLRQGHLPLRFPGEENSHTKGKITIESF